MYGIWDKTEMLNLTFYSIKEIVRFGVPMFLMITGMLTLNKTIDLNIFLKKKFVRIVYPLIFFLIVGALLKIYNMDSFFTTYWYCWMIIAIYLAIPIINKFVSNASMKEIEYFLALFIITSLIYTICLTQKVKIALDLNFFIGPASYLILGYYLSKKDFKLSPNKLVLINLLIFIGITLYKIYNKDFLYVDQNFVVYSLLNLSIPQIIQCASLFLLFRYLYESVSGISGKIRNVLENKYINGFILSVSRASYGIYLFHMLILRGLIEPYFKHASTMTGFTTLVVGFAIGFALLVVSWIAILILGKIPVINKVSGYA